MFINYKSIGVPFFYDFMKYLHRAQLEKHSNRYAHAPITKSRLVHPFGFNQLLQQTAECEQRTCTRLAIFIHYMSVAYDKKL